MRYKLYQSLSSNEHNHFQKKKLKINFQSNQDLMTGNMSAMCVFLKKYLIPNQTIDTTSKLPQEFIKAPRDFIHKTQYSVWFKVSRHTTEKNTTKNVCVPLSLFLFHTFSAQMMGSTRCALHCNNIVFRTWSCLSMQAFDTFILNGDVYTSRHYARTYI